MKIVRRCNCRSKQHVIVAVSASGCIAWNCSSYYDHPISLFNVKTRRDPAKIIIKPRDNSVNILINPFPSRYFLDINLCCQASVILLDNYLLVILFSHKQIFLTIDFNKNHFLFSFSIQSCSLKFGCKCWCFFSMQCHFAILPFDFEKTTTTKKLIVQSESPKLRDFLFIRKLSFLRNFNRQIVCFRV